jgi:hypothetical protein
MMGMSANKYNKKPRRSAPSEGGGDEGLVLPVVVHVRRLLPDDVVGDGGDVSGVWGAGSIDWVVMLVMVRYVVCVGGRLRLTPELSSDPNNGER